MCLQEEVPNSIHGHLCEASVNASPTDAVVEIGPGHGAITEGLYASGCDLTLIELDRDLIPGLLASFVTKVPERCRLINSVRSLYMYCVMPVDDIRMPFGAPGVRHLNRISSEKQDLIMGSNILGMALASWSRRLLTVSM